jgi:hypothetical protein
MARDVRRRARASCDDPGSTLAVKNDDTVGKLLSNDDDDRAGGDIANACQRLFVGIA